MTLVMSLVTSGLFGGTISPITCWGTGKLSADPQGGQWSDIGLELADWGFHFPQCWCLEQGAFLSGSASGRAFPSESLPGLGIDIH